MKQSYLIILFALLGLTLTSCTKETINDGTYAVAAEPTNCDVMCIHRQ